MRPDELSALIKGLARKQGFERCGIAPIGPVERHDYVRRWLAGGRAGSMDYLQKYIDQRLNPALLFEGARSIVVVALSYHQHSPQPRASACATDKPKNGLPVPWSDHQAEPMHVANRISPKFARAEARGSEKTGRIAMYAWGEDYHVVVKDKLFAMMRQLKTEALEPFEYRVCVDTSPLIEREAAAIAGIGWIGKNTLVLNPEMGSFFFLGAAVTTLDLATDEPLDNHCGTCTACLDACPTQAFPAPYEMDASRCISYLTIEHRGDITPELAGKMDNWVFGCDVCQDVCPFNRHAPTTKEPRLASRPPAPTIPVNEVLSWSPEDYRSALRGTAMKRAKLNMWQRNVRIVATKTTALNDSEGGG